MLRQKPDGLIGADALILSPEPDYSLDDLRVRVSGLPFARAVLKADGATRVEVGDTLTAAEFADRAGES